MINFHNIKWKNLLSTGNYFTEINLNSKKNTLIIGENGSGKSTVLDALCFVLFGKAFRNINKPNLLNSINQRECLVEVVFDTNGKKYKIVRGIKPTIFEIYCDGDLVNQDAASRDYQEYLEKSILKLNYKSFTQIVILGSASFVPFMQLSASDRRAIIEDLLDIQIFSSMNNIIKEKLSNNKDLVTDKKYQIDLTKQKYELIEQYINEQKQYNENKIKELEHDIEENQNTVIKLSAENDKLNIAISELTQEIVEKEKLEIKIKKINKLETQIENNKHKFEKDVEFFVEHDNCPTCKQLIEQEFKNTEIQILTNKVEECNKGLIEIEAKLLLEQAKLNCLIEKQKTLQKYNIKLATNDSTIAEIMKYISKIHQNIEDLKLSKANAEKNERELLLLKETLMKHQNDLKELLELKNYYEVASSLLKDTGIKTKIIKQYLPVINKLVNKYLASLDFFVNFNLDESFKETIKSRHRDEFTYNNFSEGEKQRIDMSLMLTWRAISKLKNSNNTNLLILDEIFDSSLDSNGTEYLMNILHMLEGTNLFVISHKGDVLQDKFSEVIKFGKVKNFSRIIK